MTILGRSGGVLAIFLAGVIGAAAAWSFAHALYLPGAMQATATVLYLLAGVKSV